MNEIAIEYSILGFALAILYMVFKKLMNHLSTLTESINSLRIEIVELKTIIKLLLKNTNRSSEPG